MLDQLIHIDSNLFKWINQGMIHPTLDVVLPILRNKLTWIPAYIVLVFLIIRTYKYNSIYIFIVIGVVIAVADVSSSQFIKKWIMRPRPCHDVSMSARLLIDCGSGFSFTSSHATNHFALAMILFLLFKKNLSTLFTLLLFMWAISIGFAQIYVGVHYPFDVVGGFSLGGLIAVAVYYGSIPFVPSIQKKLP